MQISGACFDRVGYGVPPISGTKRSGIPNLPTHLRVTRGSTHHNGSRSLGVEDLDNLADSVFHFVADKSRGLPSPNFSHLDNLLFLRGPRPRPLFIHQLLETFLVDGKTSFPRHQFGE